eukprot:scpid43931/ scgid20639/ NADP-dependent oxidoreductase domain-containing protein 1; Pyrroline-5-carboxylate reductase-like protein C14orf148 homolog
MEKSSASVDITDGLASLQFGSGNDSELLGLLPLKRRFRQHTCGSCAAAAFFVASLNGALKLALSTSRNPISTVSARRGAAFWKQRKRHGAAVDDVRLRVGFIGCGRLARQLLSVLVAFSSVKPCDVVISTPRLGEVEDLQALGISCIFDNLQVVQQADIVFLCCLSFALKEVASDIFGQIPPRCIIYSVVASNPATRLRNILRHDQVVTLPHAERGDTGGERKANEFSGHGSSVASKSTVHSSGLAAGSSVHASTSQSLLSVDYAPMRETAAQSDQFTAPSLRDEGLEMLTQSLPCISTVGDDSERHVAAQHIFTLLRSRQFCTDIFPLARLLTSDHGALADDDGGIVTVDDGINWAAQLTVAVWNMILSLFSCSHSEAVSIINWVLFDRKSSPESHLSQQTHVLSSCFLCPDDLQLSIASGPGCHGTVRNDGAALQANALGLDDFAPQYSLCDVQVAFPCLWARFTDDLDLAGAIQKKFLALFGMSSALHGKSATKISTRSWSTKPQRAA